MLIEHLKLVSEAFTLRHWKSQTEIYKAFSNLPFRDFNGYLSQCHSMLNQTFESQSHKKFISAENLKISFHYLYKKWKQMFISKLFGLIAVPYLNHCWSVFLLLLRTSLGYVKQHLKGCSRKRYLQFGILKCFLLV